MVLSLEKKGGRRRLAPFGPTPAGGAYGVITLAAVLFAVGVLPSSAAPSSSAEGMMAADQQQQQPISSEVVSLQGRFLGRKSLDTRLWAAKLHRAFSKEFAASASETRREVVEEKGKDAPSGAMVFAPQVIIDVLGMLREGAAGDTRAEMDRFVEQPQVYDVLWHSLTPTKSLQKGGKIEFRHAHALFVDKSVEHDDQYEQFERRVMGKYRKPPVFVVDFPNKKGEAVKCVNDWVTSKTSGRISHVLNEGDVTQETRLVLLSATYFKAAWACPFEREKTAFRDFTTIASIEDGSKVEVKVPNVLFMHKTFEQPEFVAGAHFYVSSDATVAELPYAAEGWNMVVVMPHDPQKFESFNTETMVNNTWVIDNLVAAARSKKQLRRRRTTPVEFFLPKFRIEAKEMDMEPVLRHVGIEKMFSPAADFSNMTSHLPIYVSKFVTKTMVEVTEEGTAAAAVATVVADLLSLRVEDKPDVIVIDKPFLAFIRYTPQNAGAPPDDITVFQWRVTNPLPLQKEFKEDWTTAAVTAGRN